MVIQICAHIIEGDRKYRDENESFGEHGFTEQEFVRRRAGRC